MRIPLGTFHDIGKQGYWWTTSTTADETKTPKYAGLSYDSDVLAISTIEKEAGLSIRCLKD